MSYRKIYYDEIWEITSKSAELCKKWIENIEKISKNEDKLVGLSVFKGAAADGIKEYVSQVHGLLDGIMTNICYGFLIKAVSYYSGYKNQIDQGDGSDRYTTIIYDEVDFNHRIRGKIKNIQDRAETVSSEARKIKNSISGLVNLPTPRVDELIKQLNVAAYEAVSLSRRAEEYEESRQNDFAELDVLINSLQKIINSQLGKNRVPLSKFELSSIGDMCDFNQLVINMNKLNEDNKKFAESSEYEEAMNLAFNREAIIKEEEKEKRKWVKWVAVGISVAGSIVLTVVTLGTAAPFTCAIVGGTIGITTTAVNKFADNYVENGSFTEGMNWNEFTKDCLKAGIGGMISGYCASATIGSSIQQPIDKALFSVAKTAVGTASDGLIDTAVDVGEAIISKKPGDEILSILEEDTQKMVKQLTVDMGSAFVEGYIEGKFGVSSAEKGFLRRFGEATVKNTAGTVVEGTLNTVWDIGESVVDPNSSKTMQSILDENIKKAKDNFIKSEVSSMFSEISKDVDKKLDKINGNFSKVILKTSTETIFDTAGTVTDEILDQGTDYLIFGKKTNGKIVDFNKIWEEELDSGFKILENSGKNLGNNIVKVRNEEKEFRNKLAKKDYDKDGKVDIVVFDKYSVLKEDYDAAVALAGKGDYKDQMVQDILGLPRKTAVSESYVKIVSADIDDLKKSSYKGRKTTNATKIEYNIGPSQQMENPNLFKQNKAGVYSYKETEYGKKASGQLILEDGTRDKKAQLTVGGKDRLKDDQGSHLIARMFNGDGKEKNLEAVNRNVNQRTYAEKEREWKKGLENGDKIYLNVESFKSNESDRPDSVIGYTITEHPDGSREFDTFSFQNESTAEQEKWEKELESIPID